MRVPFAEWAPDVAETDAAVASVARNVYPGVNSYTPIRGADTPYSDALPDEPRGLFLAKKQSGTFSVIAGTASTLNVLSGTTWGSNGSGFAVPVDELWSGAQFGTQFIMTNIVDGPQVYDIEAGGSFGALGGSPPAARYVDVIEDYVVLASLSSDPFAIRWSDTNDAEEWSAGNSQAQSFPDGGRVQNFSGAAGLVIQETVVRRMVHQPGSSVVFTFETLEQSRGTIAPFSVIKYGPSIAYLAEGGFWFNGEPIGQNRINNYFLGLVDQTRLFSVLGAFDPIRPIFYWLARTTDDPVYDLGLVYNWHAKKWSEFEPDVYAMSNVATPGVTLEQLGALYPTLEDVPYLLDSRVWQGGRPVLGVIDADYKLAFYEGNTLEATIETGERQVAPRRAMVRSVRPIVDSSSAACTVGKRERQADTRSWGTEAAMQTSGVCPVRASSRFFRFRTRVPAAATWTHAVGVEIEASPLGAR